MFAREVGVEVVEPFDARRAAGPHDPRRQRVAAEGVDAVGERHRLTVVGRVADHPDAIAVPSDRGRAMRAEEPSDLRRHRRDEVEVGRAGRDEGRHASQRRLLVDQTLEFLLLARLEQTVRALGHRLILGSNLPGL